MCDFFCTFAAENGSSQKTDFSSLFFPLRKKMHLIIAYLKKNV